MIFLNLFIADEDVEHRRLLILHPPLLSLQKSEKENFQNSPTFDVGLLEIDPLTHLLERRIYCTYARLQNVWPFNEPRATVVNMCAGLL